MSTAVMGLPLGGHVGVPLTSRVLEWTPGNSLPSLPLWVRVPLTAVGGAVEPARGASLFTGVLLLVVSDLIADVAVSFCC